MPSLGVTAEDLVNDALTNLGEDEIDSLTDDDDKSITCARIYNAVRDEVLGLYPWRCLIKKVSLAQLVTAPVNKWTYAYQLPTDRIGEIRAVYNSGAIGATPYKLYDIMENTLLTDAPAIWVDYPWLIDEGSFPNHIRALMRLVTTARLAEPITEDSSKADKWEAKAYGSPSEDGMGGYFARARLLDSTMRPSQELANGQSDFIAVRS